MHFIFGCVILFDLIFVKGIKSVSRFFFFFCMYNRCPIVQNADFGYCTMQLIAYKEMEHFCLIRNTRSAGNVGFCSTDSP